MDYHRTWKRALAIVTAALAVAVVAPTSATATPGYCGLQWGSLTKTAPDTGAGSLTNVRAGRHQCYDRLVLDTTEPNVGYHVSYVSQLVEDPTGNPLPLRGGAKLQVVVRAPAYDAMTGTPTYTYPNRAELVPVAGYQTFRQVAWAGSFEGQTNVGLGVRARLPFRVFALATSGGGSRLVVDVAHFW